jgi:hypothetical protein
MNHVERLKEGLRRNLSAKALRVSKGYREAYTLLRTFIDETAAALCLPGGPLVQGAIFLGHTGGNG